MEALAASAHTRLCELRGNEAGSPGLISHGALHMRTEGINTYILIPLLLVNLASTAVLTVGRKKTHHFFPFVAFSGTFN